MKLAESQNACLILKYEIIRFGIFEIISSGFSKSTCISA
jgi:hypothetical protein